MKQVKLVNIEFQKTDSGNENLSLSIESINIIFERGDNTTYIKKYVYDTNRDAVYRGHRTRQILQEIALIFRIFVSEDIPEFQSNTMEEFVETIKPYFV